MAMDTNSPWRTVLGTVYTRAGDEQLAWTVQDLLGHAWLLGRSGRGKSTALLNVASDLMDGGFGIGVIDPHGDLSEQLLAAIPSSRVRDLVYFNPTSEHVVTFNPVANVAPDHVAARAAELLAAFKAVWGEVGWGARMERILYFSIAALIEAPSTTLLALPRLLTDDEFRDRLLRHVKDPVIRTFFSTEFAAWDRAYRSAAIDPILNKVAQLLASPDVRCILGTVTSSIDFAEIMDTRKIFIANLSKGRLGPVHAQLLGALLTSQFLATALQRAETHPIEASRVPFILAIDEAGTFTTQAFAEAVSEVRKFKLGLVLANQFLRQLPAELQSALRANVGNIVAFELSGEDAPELAVDLQLPRSNYILSELGVGETYMTHATFGGPLHVYMREAIARDGKWTEAALKQHIERNTYDRTKIEAKLARFYARQRPVET